MKGSLAVAVLVLVAAPTLAQAQIGCLPPEEPFPYEPPAAEDDPEMRALIDEQYQDYIRSAESYMNCLNDEATRIRAEFDQILQRYVQFYGSEAGVEYDETN